MKKVILLLIGFCCAALPVLAQDVNELTTKGKKAYLEVQVIKGDIPDAYQKAKERLTGSEWNEWAIVDKPEEGDFTLKLILEKLGASLTSDGARVRAVVEILDGEGNVLWQSKKHQGNATMFTGWDSLGDAMNKVVRRALNEELRGINN